MPSIFISYRRTDSQDVTGRIHDRLKAQFTGKRDQIFRDVDSIPLGVKFSKYLGDVLDKSDIVLVIIGRDWLKASDDFHRRRLDDPNDIVRLEVELALRSDVPVIPVLVSNAVMPRADELPPSLQGLAERHGTCVRPDPDFNHDIRRLVAGIKDLPSRRHPAPDPIPAPELPPRPQLERESAFRRLSRGINGWLPRIRPKPMPASGSDSRPSPQANAKGGSFNQWRWVSRGLKVIFGGVLAMLLAWLLTIFVHVFGIQSGSYLSGAGESTFAACFFASLACCGVGGLTCCWFVPRRQGFWARSSLCAALLTPLLGVLMASTMNRPIEFLPAIPAVFAAFSWILFHAAVAAAHGRDSLARLSYWFAATLLAAVLITIAVMNSFRPADVSAQVILGVSWTLVFSWYLAIAWWTFRAIDLTADRTADRPEAAS
jgi:TIR domain